MSADIEMRDYEFYVGTDYVRRLTLEEGGSPVSLTDYSAAMQLRTTYSSDVSFELSTQNGRIEIHPDEGQIDLIFRSGETVDVRPGRYLYDLELKAPDDTIVRLMAGTITFLPEVTRIEDPGRDDRASPVDQG